MTLSDLYVYQVKWSFFLTLLGLAIMLPLGINPGYFVLGVMIGTIFGPVVSWLLYWKRQPNTTHNDN